MKGIRLEAGSHWKLAASHPVQAGARFDRFPMGKIDGTYMWKVGRGGALIGWWGSHASQVHMKKILLLMQAVVPPR